MSDNSGRGRGRGRGRGSRNLSGRSASSSASPRPPVSSASSLATVPQSTTSPDNRCDELKEKIDTIETTFGRLSDEFKNEKAKTTQLETEKRDCDNEKAALQASVNTLEGDKTSLEEEKTNLEDEIMQKNSENVTLEDRKRVLEDENANLQRQLADAQQGNNTACEEMDSFILRIYFFFNERLLLKFLFLDFTFLPDDFFFVFLPPTATSSSILLHI
jgi:septal ring factor EnvC (AmiA/AmiB activator)